MPRNDQTLSQKVSDLQAVSEVQKATGRIRDKKVGSQNVFGGLVSYKKLTLAQEKRGKTTPAHTMQAYEAGENA